MMKRKKSELARLLLFCCCFVKGDTGGAELALVQYTECVPPLNAVDEKLGVVCLLWATIKDGEDESEVGRSVNENYCEETGEWCGAIFFGVLSVLCMYFGELLLVTRLLQSCRGVVFSFTLISFSENLE